jgi:hypothetical protein
MALSGETGKPRTFSERRLIEKAAKLGEISSLVAQVLLWVCLIAAVILVLTALSSTDLRFPSLVLAGSLVAGGGLYWIVFQLAAIIADYIKVRTDRLGE